MLYPLLALGSSLAESLKDVAAKQRMRDASLQSVAFVQRVFAIPILLFLAWLQGFPERLSLRFWITLAICGTMNTGISLLYLRACRDGELSHVAPLISFTPLFMLITSPLLLGEFPGRIGLLGIALIVAGAYALSLDLAREGPFAPLLSLIREPAPRMMLVVAFFWSITSVIDKIGVGHSNPTTWALAMTLWIAVGQGALLLWRKGTSAFDRSLLHPKGLLIGTLTGLSNAMQMAALTGMLAVYVISVKRMSGVWGVLFGRLFFHERKTRQRLLGALLMVAGAMLIAFTSAK